MLWDVQAPAEQLSFLRGTVDRPIVWHLHGHVGNLANIILTPDSYSRLYFSGTPSDDLFHAALNTLRYQFASHSFLFIGFSFNDDHLRSQLRQIEEIYQGGSGPHYALVQRGEERLLMKMGTPRIEPLTYDFHGVPLLNKLRELASSVRGTAPQGATIAPQIRTVPVTAANIAVRIPPFHYGSIVPTNFFIDRELEEERAWDYISTRQSFLIVGHRRAGKTSFGQKLVRSVAQADHMRVNGCLVAISTFSSSPSWMSTDFFLTRCSI